MLPINLTLFQADSNKFNESLPNFPNSLNVLNLGSNLLIGNIPKLPNELLQLFLYDNLLSGSLMQNWPLKLTSLNIKLNDLNGTFPSQPLKLCDTINISFNRFNGCLNVPLMCTFCTLASNQFQNLIIFQKPQIMNIRDNQFNNVSIIDTSKLIGCQLDNNPLLNVIGNLTFASKCTKSGLFADTSNFTCPLISNIVTTDDLTKTTASFTTVQSEMEQPSIVKIKTRIFLII
eukprot:NODE_353_length_8928_cov_0.455204.p4 type:complete len:232 gc:universal NODE_353_length_8928_cov_0.455204:7105-7800(+)